MDLFGANFSFALGAWKLRFVLMIEDAEDVPRQAAQRTAPHHLKERTEWRATAR